MLWIGHNGLDYIGSLRQSERSRTVCWRNEMTLSASVMSVYLYEDCVRLIREAEKARRSAGTVNSDLEETLSRSALLSLALSFEAFVNEQVQEDWKGKLGEEGGIQGEKTG